MELLSPTAPMPLGLLPPAVAVGLAMVLGLLRALGGDVRVDSEPGRGSTVTFVLDPERG